MTEATHGSDKETLEEFRKSLSYGSRSDLSFKFLAGMTDEQAADFLQELLRQVVVATDTGSVDSLSRFVIDGQAAAYSGATRWTYEDGPFARPEAPVTELRVGLLTSSGHFVEGDDPRPLGVAGMTQEEAVRRIGEFGRMPPKLSEIPIDTPPERLRVLHGGYDVRGALADPEVVLPLQTLRGLSETGAVGGLAPRAYSFVGVTAQRPLLERYGPEWVEKFRDDGIGGMLLVPA